MRSPFSLFTRTSKETGKTSWYARFWDEEANRYTQSRALHIPFAGKRNGRDLALYAAKSLAAQIKRDEDPFLIDFVTAFWAPESRHIKSRAMVDKRPLSTEYLSHNRRSITLYLSPFPGFKALRLSKLKAGIVKDWQLWVMERGGTPRSCNMALQTLRVPVRDAVTRGELPGDPLAIIKKIPEHPKERGVLTPKEITSLLRIEDGDPRIRAAILLAVLGGLRRGEIRGLRWGDIDWEESLLHIRHNAVNEELDKPPKTGSYRDIPLHRAVSKTLKEVLAVSPQIGQDDFVFFSLYREKTPLTGHALLNGLCQMLQLIGINEVERRRRNLNLHAMRHSFITLARSLGMPDISVMALSGHKSPEMLTRYSHGNQTIDIKFVRSIIEESIQ
jgi:integrase